MKFVFFFIFASIFSSSQAFWSNCPGDIPPFDYFASPQCSIDRCRAVRGETFYSQLFFTPLDVFHVLNVRATAFVFGIGINLPLSPPHDDMCTTMLFPNGTFAGCPTVPNQQYFGDVAMHISEIFPAFNNARVQVDIVSATGQRVFCMQLNSIDVI